MREKSEYSHAICDRNEHNTFLREPATVIERVVRAATNERATIDPDHDRKFFARALCRCPHIEVEAVLTHVGRSTEAHGEGRVLNTRWSERIRVLDALPRRHRLWSSPAIFARRRGGEGHTLE